MAEKSVVTTDVEAALPLPPGPKVDQYSSLQYSDSEKVIVLSFRGLQLRRIAELQDELLRLSAETANAENLTPNDKAIDAALASYGESSVPRRETRCLLSDIFRVIAQALRNYETLSQNAVPTIPAGAYFVGILSSVGPIRKSRREVSRKVSTTISRLASPLQHLQDTISRMLARSPEASLAWAGITTVFEIVNKQFNKQDVDPALVQAKISKAIGQVGYRELDQNGRILRDQKKAFTARMIFALVGGVALIAPVLIMTLHPSRNTSLITVSVATFLFALVMALWATDMVGKDVLATTAAYVAVLVVFIGTSLPT